MCLVNRLNSEKLKKFKETLPDTFPVWKAMRRKGQCQYYHPRIANNKNEQALKEKGIYFARNCLGRRMNLHGTYKPGFHVFLSQADARKYKPYFCGVKKFQAKRSWIKVVGETEHTFFRSIVLSRIEVL